MKFGLKILGLLLITALVIAPLAMNALAEAGHASASFVGQLAGLGARPAGCHAHGGKSLPDSPRPVPVSYQCCLTGHDAAVVPASHSPQPSAPRSRVIQQIKPALTICFLGSLGVLMVLSADPPGTTPMRI